MSAVEFGLASQSPFPHSFSPVPFERPLTGSEALSAHYEALSQLSRSIASMTLEDISRDLVALLRPLFPCDLANIVIVDQGADLYPFTSIGAAQLASLDGPMEETRTWPTYEEEKPLWAADSQNDERSLVSKEAQKAAGVGYRSLCRLPLRTPQGCMGVLSVASARPHSYSEQDAHLMLLAADQVAMGLANSLLRAELQKLKDESCDDKTYIEGE